MKNIKIIYFIGVAILFLFNEANAQNSSSDNGNQLVKVIPASPTAASLGTYGNIPVSYYTGTPSINIPLFEINSGNIKLPVTINHHGGGIKVEEMASWVGLGWSLNAGGVITRSVRGTPDDANNGFMVYQPRKVQFIIDNLSNPNYAAEIKEYLRQAGQGQYDLEADIFYFNFGNYSGKFFYDQEANEFYTIPRTNIKINYNINGNFIFTDENGFKYYFTIKEYTNSGTDMCTNGGQSAPPVNYNYGINTTAWYLSKIENQTASDEITFEYAYNYYTYYTTGSSVRYILTEMASCIPSGDLPDMNPNHCNQNIAIDGQKLAFIRFKNGYLKFTSTNARCDLTNDESLDKVELYNLSDELIKRFIFEYGYFGENDVPGNCPYPGSPSSRLKLNKLTELNSVANVVTSKNPYIFEYDQSQGQFFPSRLGFAQDHWGYYNGANSNPDLISPYFYASPNGPIFWGTSDRKVNSAHNQIGALKKIIYPTAGFSEFVYESNEIDDPAIDPIVIWNYHSIEGDHNGGVQTYYESAPFVINEPPSPLNGFNPNGGAYVSAQIAEIGNCYPNCFSPPTTCAVLLMQGLSQGSSSLGPVTCNINNVYTPNGTYKLTASFQQFPQGYEDFYFQVKWPSMDPNYTNSRPVGGLRLKKTIDYDGISHANDIVKNFSYTNENNNISSGKLNGKPLQFSMIYEQHYLSAPDCNPCDYYRKFIKLNSFSNYPLLSSNGSYVGYENVIVKYGQNGAVNGQTNYKFRNTIGDLFWDFPFPTMTRDWLRGQLNEEKNYKNESSNLSLVNKSVNSYTPSDYGSNAHKSINGLKAGYNKAAIGNTGAPCFPIYFSQMINEFSIPIVNEYETSAGYLFQTGSDKTIYDQADINRSILLTEVTEYNDLNFQPSSITQNNSRQEMLITKVTYPVDYPGCVEYGISLLLENNMNTVPIERYTIKKMPNNQEYVISGTLMKYSSGSPIPEKIYSLQLSEPLLLTSFVPSYYSTSSGFVKDGHYVEQISFNNYDPNFNLLEQQKTGDIKSSFIWDYNKSYPIAEAINAAVADIAYTSFEADGKGGFTFTGNIVTDNSAPTGKSVYNLLGSSYITKNIDNTKSFVVSLWANNNQTSVNNQAPTRTGQMINGYTYYEYDITNASTLTISGGGRIDEVRLYPVGAQMKTYTYEPLVGMTSQTDINNKTTYYEYDALNRLAIIRDQDKNILKKICYNYAGQPENCTTCPPNSPANWQNTSTALRCQLGSCGNTGYQEQEQQDINPCSPTFNQTQWVTVGYNPTACSLESCIALSSYNDTGDEALVVNYYNISTGLTYTFNVPFASGQQPLGNIAAGTYNITISKLYSIFEGVFSIGCGQTISGETPVTFSNINISSTNCNLIHIQLPKL